MVSQPGCGLGDRTWVLQTLSPYNKGLIRRAISQSGVALSPWAIQKDPLFWAKKVSAGGQGTRAQGPRAFLIFPLCPGSCPCPQTAPCLVTGLPYLCPQVAKKVGCPLDDTARLARCLKITDPHALTMAYKAPLVDLECEWVLLGGTGIPGVGAAAG